MWLLCVWVPSLRELMSSIMRWRSGLIASVIIGNSCLRSGSRDPDLQDRMTHTLLTISPRVEPYRCAPRPPPRAIAQRFSAMALFRHRSDDDEGPLEDNDFPGRAALRPDRGTMGSRWPDRR